MSAQHLQKARDKFVQVRNAYRAGEVSDEEFIAGRDKYENFSDEYYEHIHGNDSLEWENCDV